MCRKEGERKRESGRRGAVEERDQVEEGGKETDASWEFIYTVRCIMTQGAQFIYTVRCIMTQGARQHWQLLRVVHLLLSSFVSIPLTISSLISLRVSMRP